mmetsp:Transcript_12793/g.53583  ORF Transcript_12793/g.53583 Transcript_12793/m.53583 type:complete len:240 (-) Transcript_12793:576-1295(-)
MKPTMEPPREGDEKATSFRRALRPSATKTKTKTKTLRRLSLFCRFWRTARPCSRGRSCCRARSSARWWWRAASSDPRASPRTTWCASSGCSRRTSWTASPPRERCAARASSARRLGKTRRTTKKTKTKTKTNLPRLSRRRPMGLTPFCRSTLRSSRDSGRCATGFWRSGWSPVRVSWRFFFSPRQSWWRSSRRTNKSPRFCASEARGARSRSRSRSTRSFSCTTVSCTHSRTSRTPGSS